MGEVNDLLAALDKCATGCDGDGCRYNNEAACLCENLDCTRCVDLLAKDAAITIRSLMEELEDTRKTIRELYNSDIQGASADVERAISRAIILYSLVDLEKAPVVLNEKQKATIREWMEDLLALLRKIRPTKKSCGACVKWSRHPGGNPQKGICEDFPGKLPTEMFMDKHVVYADDQFDREYWCFEGGADNEKEENQGNRGICRVEQGDFGVGEESNHRSGDMQGSSKAGSAADESGKVNDT